MSSQALRGHIGRGPDALTAHFASGGRLEDDESAWVEQHLAELGALRSADGRRRAEFSLKELKNVYLGARIIVGSVVASQLALPAVVEAGEILRAAALPEDLDLFARLGAAQTEFFLSGADQGQTRGGNDYPAPVKKYISAIAGILNGPYEKAFEQLQEDRPELWELALDADELQRLCWGHLRWRINEVVPADQMASFRSRPLQEGTNELLALIKELTGVTLPPRIVQRDSQDYVDPRDDWRAALEEPRQDPRLALLCGIRFSVENAEIATLYCLGSMLMRVGKSGASEAVLHQQIRFGVQDIAWGTRLVTHNARFQSRRGARPNYWRSFDEFLRNVRKQTGASVIQENGRIDWRDAHSAQIRGWCPAQNRYAGKGSDDVASFAEGGRDAITAWSAYAQRRFGVVPEYSQPTVGELLASVVLFAVLHDGSPLRPESELMRVLASSL